MKNAVWLSISTLVNFVSTAFVAMYMWQWFIVRPLGLPSLSFLQMLGLVGLKEIIFYNWSSGEDSRHEMIKEVLIEIVNGMKVDKATRLLNYLRNNGSVLSLVVSLWDIVMKSLILAFGYGLQFWTV